MEGHSDLVGYYWNALLKSADAMRFRGIVCGKGKLEPQLWVALHKRNYMKRI